MTSDVTKKRYAAESLAYNVKSNKFCELFPDLVELQEARKAEFDKLNRETLGSSAQQPNSLSKSGLGKEGGVGESADPHFSWFGIASIFIVFVVTYFAIVNAI